VIVRLTVIAALAASLVPTAQAATAQTSTEPVRGFILHLKADAAEGSLVTLGQTSRRHARLASLARQAGYTGSMPWRHLSNRMVSVRLPSDVTPEQQARLMARWMSSGQVEWVEPNVKMWAHQVLSIAPNDTQYVNNSQWWARASTSAGSGSGTRQNAGVPNLTKAWTTEYNGAGTALTSVTPVAVLDTGRVAHDDLYPRDTNQATSRALPGHDFVADAQFAGDGGGRDADESDPGDFVSASEASQAAFRQLGCGVQDSSWHGLAIEGILGAKVNNNLGIAGIHWNPRIVAVRVAGKCGADLDDILSAMYWVAKVNPSQSLDASLPSNPNPRARVVNISFGGSESCGFGYQTAVNDLKNNGVVVVASAGNEHGAVSRPASCQNVVAVAALNRLGLKSTYSNFGAAVTISTVGGDPGPGAGYTDAGVWGSALGDDGIFTTSHNDNTAPALGTSSSNYAIYAGTSFSAPMVAGVIGMMLDVAPSLSVDDVFRGLRASARPHATSALIGQCSNDNPGRCVCTTSTCGAGMLDAHEALRWARLVNAGQEGSYINPAVAQVLEADPTVETRIRQALALASKDRVANNQQTPAATGAGATGGGGGGAFGGLWVLALGLIAAVRQAWRYMPKRRVGGVVA
jgi:serine protease